MKGISWRNQLDLPPLLLLILIPYAFIYSTAIRVVSYFIWKTKCQEKRRANILAPFQLDQLWGEDEELLLPFSFLLGRHINLTLNGKLHSISGKWIRRLLKELWMINSWRVYKNQSWREILILVGFIILNKRGEVNWGRRALIWLDLRGCWDLLLSMREGRAGQEQKANCVWLLYWNDQDQDFCLLELLGVVGVDWADQRSPSTVKREKRGWVATSKARNLGAPFSSQQPSASPSSHSKSTPLLPLLFFFCYSSRKLDSTPTTTTLCAYFNIRKEMKSSPSPNSVEMDLNRLGSKSSNNTPSSKFFSTQIQIKKTKF